MNETLKRDARKMDENVKIIERKRKMIRRHISFCVRRAIANDEHYRKGMRKSADKSFRKTLKIIPYFNEHHQLKQHLIQRCEGI